jgi:hypothetical protein
MQRSVRLFLPILLAGCASAPPGSIPEAREDRSTVGVSVDAVGTSSVQLKRDASIRSSAVAAAPEVVWAAVPRAFEKLELPVTGVNTGVRVLSTTGQRLKRVGGKSIANFFDCPGPYGNAASSSDVYVTVNTQVLPGEASGTSTLRSEVGAYARSSTSGRNMSCRSKGGLEKLLLETVQAELSGG